MARDAGKFHNRTFAYTIPAETLREVEADRKVLLKWARSKAEGCVREAITPWDETGTCK